MTDFASRLARVQPSAIRTPNERARELKAMGRDPIDLSIGEPDCETPENVKQAAIDAIRRGETRYTEIHGSWELRDAIGAKFKRDHGLDFSRDQITVAPGAKLIIFNAMMATLDAGDEVIIPAPYWVSYPDMVLLADAEPVIVQGDQEQGFKITAAQLAAAITDKTRLFVINSPSNPSGKAYTLAELKALGEVLLKHPQILIATDDMYEHIIWTKEGFCNILNACPELYERTIVLNGVSKAYAMTGWRIGYAGGPADLIKGMKKVQSQSTSNPSSISQVAAQAALEGDQSRLQEMNTAFKQRHDYVLSALNNMDGVSSLASDGTFYIFPDFQQVMDRMGISDDVKLASKTAGRSRSGTGARLGLRQPGTYAYLICHRYGKPAESP